jgi:hypothetical protein
MPSGIGCDCCSPILVITIYTPILGAVPSRALGLVGYHHKPFAKLSH